jgi:V8-like Glu-specific endopeptidase
MSGNIDPTSNRYKAQIKQSIKDQPIYLISKPPSEPLPTISAPSEFNHSTSSSVELPRKKLCFSPLHPSHSLTWPISAHGQLITLCENIKKVSSGTVIGRNFVLTAASNIYNRYLNKEVSKDSIEFIPGPDSDTNLFKPYRAKEIYYPQEYVLNGTENYALIVLESDVGRYTGWYGITKYKKEKLQGKTGYICVNTREELKREDEIKGENVRLEIDLNEEWVEYELEGTIAPEGAGIYLIEDRSYNIIGIQNSSNTSNSRNSAAYINESRIQIIKSWISSYYTKYEILSVLNLQLEANDSINFIIDELLEHDNSELSAISLDNSSLGPIGATQLVRLNLLNVTSLKLEGNGIGPEGCRSLSRANIPNLEYLNLSYNRLGSEGASELARCNFNSLSSLELEGNNIEPEGARALFNGNLSNISRLALDGNKIGHEGARYLSTGNMKSIEFLALGGNNIGPEGASYIKTGNFKKLRHLGLYSNLLGDEGAQYLALGNYPKIEYLDVSYNDIGPSGARSLARGNLSSLLELEIICNSIGPYGAKELATGNLVNLKLLALDENDIGSDGAREIARGVLRNLKYLYLCRNNIHLEGVRELARGNLTGLIALSLSRSEIGTQGEIEIRGGNFENLNNLYISSSDLEDLGERLEDDEETECEEEGNRED